MVGQRFVDDTVSIGFLGLAAGSILYVVIELPAVARKANLKTLTTWGIFVGLILGFTIDAVNTPPAPEFWGPHPPRHRLGPSTTGPTRLASSVEPGGPRGPFADTEPGDRVTG